MESRDELLLLNGELPRLAGLDPRAPGKEELRPGDPPKTLDERSRPGKLEDDPPNGLRLRQSAPSSSSSSSSSSSP